MAGTPKRRQAIYCCACEFSFVGDFQQRLHAKRHETPLGCPKCKSEDIFLKSDKLWPCSVCKREDRTGKFGHTCEDCRSNDLGL